MLENKKTGFALKTEEERLTLAQKGGLAFKQKLENDPEFREKNREKLLKNCKLNWENEDTRSKMIVNLDWTGKKHSEETKQKLSETMSKLGRGSSNSQFGTCWITKEGVNKKIKKEELETFAKLGWVKGRVTK
jgi:hypothetical protein